MDHHFPRIEIFGRTALRAQRFSLKQFRFNGGDHLLGDFILQSENIGQFAVVAIRPDMVARGGVNELRRDTHAVAALADTAFQDVTHAELTRSSFHIDGLALVGEGRVARDHKEPTQFR